MIDTAEIHAGTPVDEMKIVVNSLHLSLAFLLDRIEQIGGKAAAAEAREALISNLQSGNIDMAIMEDRELFDFVLSVVERLPTPR
jgi:proline dehydrogenase